MATIDEPSFIRIAQYGCLLVAGCVLVLTVSGRGSGRATRQITTTALTASLLFPYLVTVWQPQLSAQAAWLHIQHENLTWLGGDLYMNGEFADTPLKAGIYAVDTPRRLQIFDLPLDRPWEVDLNRLSDLLDWLGFTEPFCQFVGKGWVFALCGLIGILTFSCVADREVHRERITHAVCLAIGQLIPAALVAWSLPFAAGHQINSAQSFCRQGDYAAALQSLQRAGQLLPIVRQDTYFVVQVGLLHHLLGDRDQPEARLYLANLLERAGRTFESAEAYTAILAESPAGSPVSREAGRALLRCTIHDLNSGQVDVAINGLEAILQREPSNLKANYTLQLAYLRTGRTEQLARLVDQMRSTYAWFQSPSKKPILSFAHHNLFVAALEEGKPDEALVHYRRSLRP